MKNVRYNIGERINFDRNLFNDFLISYNNKIEIIPYVVANRNIRIAVSGQTSGRVRFALNNRHAL